MQFALISGHKTEPTPKLRGICAHCQSEMIAKCGRVKVWHWAHKSKLSCDPWWENETEWHRAWKNRFPSEWQEVSAVDPLTGERHIADVKTASGRVLEFQHSIIHPTEMQSREVFYGDMIWVVDGLRSELDVRYFKMGLSKPIQNSPLAYGLKWWGRSRFLNNWSEAKAKVYLDFGEDVLWRLVFYDADKKIGAVGPITKEAFIEDCINGTPIRVMVQENKPVATPQPVYRLPPIRRRFRL